MKIKSYFFVLILILTNSHLKAQDYEIDTVFHSPINTIETLQYDLGLEEVTRFEVTKFELKLEGKDTTKNKIEKDTLQIILKERTENFILFDLLFDKEEHLSFFYSEECFPNNWEEINVPSIKCEYDKLKNEFQVLDCEKDKAFYKGLMEQNRTCLQNSEDPYMVKFIDKWKEQIDSCKYRNNNFFRNIECWILYNGSLISTIDSLQYSISAKGENFNMDTHYLVTKRNATNGSLIVKWEEDLSLGKSSSIKFMEEMYGALEEMIPDEEKEKDKERMKSIKEDKFEEIEIDANSKFKEYRMVNFSSSNFHGTVDIDQYEFTLRRIQ